MGKARHLVVLLVGVVVLGACQAPTPDFSLSVPVEVVGVQNRSVSLEVKIERMNNFDKPVTLSLEGINGNRLPEGIRANSVANGNSSNLLITVESSLPIGTYSLQVKGTSGNLNKTAPLRLVIKDAPNFDLSASNTSLSATQGGNVSTNVRIVPNATFTATVVLSLEKVDGSALPEGLQASFSPMQNNTSALSLTIGSSVALATYDLQIKAVGDGVSKTLPITLFVTRVPDFNVSLASPSLSLIRGNNRSTSVSLERLNGFAAPVSLSLLQRNGASLPTGIAANYTPSSVSGSSSTLELSVSASVAPQIYSLMVRAISGSIIKTANLDLEVLPQPALSISLDNASATHMPGANFSRTISLNRTNLSGNVSLVLERSDGSALPSGISASFSPSSVSGNNSTLSVSIAINIIPQVINLRVRAMAGSISATTPLSLTIQTPPTGNSIIVRNFLNGHQPENATLAAFQDGAGAWQSLIGNNGLYSFRVTDLSGRYSVVLVCSNTTNPAPGNVQITHRVMLYHLTTADGSEINSRCGYRPYPSNQENTLSASGSVIGLDQNNNLAQISFVGSGFTTSSQISYNPPNDTTYRVNNLIRGRYDINSVRFSNPEVGSSYRVANRVLFEPNVSIDGNLTRDVDFNNPDAFDLVGSNTITITSGGATSSLGVSYIKPGSGAIGSVNLTQLSYYNPVSQFTYRNIPATRRVTGDSYYLGIGDSSYNSTTGISRNRQVQRGFENPTNLTLALPAIFDTSRQMIVSSGLLLPEISWNSANTTLSQVSYNQNSFTRDTQTNTNVSRELSWSIFFSNTWIGVNQRYALPNISNISNWQSTWNLNPNESTRWSFEQTNLHMLIDAWLRLIVSATPPTNFDWANFYYSTSSQSGSHNPNLLQAKNTSSLQSSQTRLAQPSNLPAWLPKFGQ